MMKLLLCTSSPGRYVDSVAEAKGTGYYNWSASGDAVDVLSVATTGDLVVMAFAFGGSPDGTWSWQGMTFTDVFNTTSGESGFNKYGYVGYRVIEAGDANPYISGLSIGAWADLSIVAAVFRGLSYSDGGSAMGEDAMPNPPLLTAAGNMTIAAGMTVRETGGVWSAPSGYTLGAYQTNSAGTTQTGAGIAYRKGLVSSENPGAFSGTGTTPRHWMGVTIAAL